MNTIIDKISLKQNKTTEEVSAIVTDFITLLHKEFYESNEDIIGTQLCFLIGPKGYYHFLGLLERFNEKYNWEVGDTSEYLLRLGSREEWEKYQEEMLLWEKPKDNGI